MYVYNSYTLHPLVVLFELAKLIYLAYLETSLKKSFHSQ